MNNNNKTTGQNTKGNAPNASGNNVKVNNTGNASGNNVKVNNSGNASGNNVKGNNCEW